tara:strand:- start:149 stop:622 length:474 start_codon:yes stop_codon:yes gene_type:complete
MPDSYQTGLKLLSRRELSTKELSERLLRKGFTQDSVSDAIQRLSDDGALNDYRTALALAHREAHIRARGQLRALREIESHGITRELSTSAVKETYKDLDEREMIEEALKKRLKGTITDNRQMRRLYQFLIRQGFDVSTTRSVLNAHTQTTGINEDLD